jgi:hypothetical protein
MSIKESEQAALRESLRIGTPKNLPIPPRTRSKIQEFLDQIIQDMIISKNLERIPRESRDL